MATLYHYLRLMKYFFFLFIISLSILTACTSPEKNIDTTSQGEQTQSGKNDESIRVEIPVPRSPEKALEDFYTYINARKYAEAYFLWDDSGKASGYEYLDFQKWYKTLSGAIYKVTGEKTLRNTLGIASVEIPVEVTLIKKDGENLSYSGSYTFIQNGTGETLTAENSYWLIFSSTLEKK